MTSKTVSNNKPNNPHKINLCYIKILLPKFSFLSNSNGAQNQSDLTFESIKWFMTKSVIGWSRVVGHVHMGLKYNMPK